MEGSVILLASVVLYSVDHHVKFIGMGRVVKKLEKNQGFEYISDQISTISDQISAISDIFEHLEKGFN